MLSCISTKHMYTRDVLPKVHGSPVIGPDIPWRPHPQHQAQSFRVNSDRTAATFDRSRSRNPPIQTRWPPRSKPSMRKFAQTSTQITSARHVRPTPESPSSRLCSVTEEKADGRNNRHHLRRAWITCWKGAMANAEQISGVRPVTLVFRWRRLRT